MEEVANRLGVTVAIFPQSAFPRHYPQMYSLPSSAPLPLGMRQCAAATINAKMKIFFISNVSTF